MLSVSEMMKGGGKCFTPSQQIKLYHSKAVSPVIRCHMLNLLVSVYLLCLF